MKPKNKTGNGITKENSILLSTICFFSFWERIRILFGARVKVYITATLKVSHLPQPHRCSSSREIGRSFKPIVQDLPPQTGAPNV